MEEWPEVIKNEGLTQQQQDLLIQLGDKIVKSHGSEATNKLAQRNATTRASHAEKEKKQDMEQFHMIIEKDQVAEDDSDDSDDSIKKQDDDYSEAENRLSTV